MLSDTIFLADRLIKHARVCLQCREAIVSSDDRSLCDHGKLLQEGVITMLKLDIALTVVNDVNS